MLCLIAACQPGVSTPQDLEIDGNVDRGRQLISNYGCSACHTIPGIPGANALVGPPLDQWANRHYIAGALVNTPENLAYWIRFPQDVEPGTAMPDLDVTEADAHDIVAYLYTLGRDQLQARDMLALNPTIQLRP